MFFALALALMLGACQSSTNSNTSTTTNPLVGTKSAANETAAIGALRTISSAQSAYSVSHDGDYGTFEELVKAGNLDVRFSGDRPVVGGYILTMKVTAKGSDALAGSFVVNADPQQDVAAGSTGSRHFYMGSTESTIHVNAKQAASSSDPQL